MADAQSYYIPHGTKWPILGSIGLTSLVGGFAAYLNGSSSGTAKLMHHFVGAWGGLSFLR